MDYKSVNLREKFSKFSEHWTPKVLAEMNEIQFRAVRCFGEFIWHKHDHTDEVFLVVSGELIIEMRDGEVRLGEGELFVVPRGVEHKPRAESEALVLIIDPRDVVNTGEEGGPMTAEMDVWV